MSVSTQEVRVGRVSVGVVLRGVRRGGTRRKKRDQFEKRERREGCEGSSRGTERTYDLSSGGDGLSGDHRKMSFGVEETSL